MTRRQRRNQSARRSRIKSSGKPTDALASGIVAIPTPQLSSGIGDQSQPTAAVETNAAPAETILATEPGDADLAETEPDRPQARPQRRKIRTFAYPRKKVSSALFVGASAPTNSTEQRKSTTLPQAKKTQAKTLKMYIAALCLCVTLIGGVLVFRTSRSAPITPVPTLSGVLPINVAQQVRVGDAVTVTVGPTSAVDGLPVALVMLGSYGPQMYQGTFTGGTARFVIPGDDTHQSGMTSLFATAGAARGEAWLTLEPDAPVDPITPLVGGRSVIADQRHWTMSTVVPFDRFGNPVADGTSVEIHTLHPDNQLETQHTLVHNLVAWARIFSRSRAGQTTVNVTAAGKSGPEVTFTEVPGWPEPFALSADPTSAPADGRQFITLRTDVIHDRFGNAMLDGTLVTFVVDIPKGNPRLIPAYTLDGVAKAQLQAPRDPGQLTVHAVVYNVESRSLQLTFTAGIAVNTFPVAARINADDQAIELSAGPILGPLQQFIPDGMPVQFLLTDPAGAQTRVTAITENGYAHGTARPASLQFGAYAVEATVGAGHSMATFQVP